MHKEEEEEEEVLYWVGILADVTSRKTSETAKTEFISLASHQLRTPLSVLRLVIETLLKGIKGPLTADQKNLVVGAGEYAKRMAETINTLLSVSLSDEGKIALSLTDVSIADILKTVQSDSKEECEEKKLACTMQCQKQLMVKTDGKLLTEIVSNLVTNAIRYTPAGGTITLRASANAKAVTIEIEDNGIGIARVDKDKIFSKFFRAENAMKICSDGTGLGLYLVHSFVILLGGTVSVESEEGIGSTFTVILPITPPQPR
ncbi:MAG: HAMP domain-containing histidine kinase [Candidatus Peribacteraceae bacterium]|nr:HAMP domain-containing histidine kinase [Candidatus Peribacteraceae bacterium]